MSLILSGTDGLSDVDGSAATPAIRGTDANTGIFFPAADTIAFAEGGAEVARFNSSGNFLVGTTSSLSVADKMTVVGGNFAVQRTSGITTFMGDNTADGYAGTATNHAFALLTNSVERARIDTSGNLGIGTTSPSSYSSKLVVNGGSANTAISIQTDSFAGTYSAALNFGTGGQGAGSQAPYYTQAQIKAVGTNDYSAAIVFSSQIAGTSNALTERARIDSSGNLLVGTTTSDARVRVSGGGTVGRFVADGGSYTGNIISADTSGTAAGTGFNLILLQAGGANQFRVRGDGTIYAQNTTVQSISDRRIKENIVDAQDGLNVVTNLRPVRFDFKEKFGNNRKNQLGFIAQEIEQVFPEAVDIWGESDDPANPYKSVGSGALIPVLVKAIQEQQALITTLTARITALESA